MIFCLQRKSLLARDKNINRILEYIRDWKC